MKTAWDDGSVDVAALLFTVQRGEVVSFRCVWHRNHTVWLRWESPQPITQRCVCLLVKDRLWLELIRWFTYPGLGCTCLNRCGGGLFLFFHGSRGGLLCMLLRGCCFCFLKSNIIVTPDTPPTCPGGRQQSPHYVFGNR